ncbi:hypothetical protein SeMB42_g00404 [Synchytrium endobioticum]|uniref:Uncharacterized protein n=1 Tax=Synchytrium endobioticum TaxID=286115 RepID=A0A507DSE3_9FUNG|nr:hypothetical protein SeMB42_g00404 [Synchytrium endobioticum]
MSLIIYHETAAATMCTSSTTRTQLYINLRSSISTRLQHEPHNIVRMDPHLRNADLTLLGGLRNLGVIRIQYFK